MYSISQVGPTSGLTLQVFRINLVSSSPRISPTISHLSEWHHFPSRQSLARWRLSIIREAILHLLCFVKQTPRFLYAPRDGLYIFRARQGSYISYSMRWTDILYMFHEVYTLHFTYTLEGAYSLPRGVHPTFVPKGPIPILKVSVPPRSWLPPQGEPTIEVVVRSSRCSGLQVLILSTRWTLNGSSLFSLPGAAQR